MGIVYQIASQIETTQRLQAARIANAFTVDRGSFWHRRC